MSVGLEEANAAMRAAVAEVNERRAARDAAASETYSEWRPPEYAMHPTSAEFCRLCDELKEMHRRKSYDYGSADDPIANIRNGAAFVQIEPWRAAAVRLSDKITRFETYCRTGRLEHEGVEDTLMDMASYALLVLLTHREAHDAAQT